MCLEEDKVLGSSRQKGREDRELKSSSDFAGALQRRRRLGGGKVRTAANRSLVRALDQANVGLPRSHRYVLQTHENEVLEADATRTDPPFHFRRILHRLVLHFLRERGVNR